MTHGSLRIQLAQAAIECELFRKRIRPVDRSRPLLALYHRPTVGQPQGGVPVAAVADELQEFGIRRRADRQLEGCEKHPMTRQLIVKREARALMPDLEQTAVEVLIGERRSSARRARRMLRESRQQRIAREQVFDVGEQQFLVLLLVVQSECQYACELRGEALLQKLEHSLVDPFPVSEYLLHGRARQQSAARAGVHRAYGVVIGVEEIAKAGVVKFVGTI